MKYEWNIYLLIGAFSGPLVQINVGLLEDNVGVSAANSLDGGHGDAHLAFAFDVCVHKTQNVLEFLGNDERLQAQPNAIKLLID